MSCRIGEGTTADDEGSDCADKKKKKLPFGPLPWPSGRPTPRNVPKRHPLNVRGVTASGNDADFIMKSIGCAWHGVEASKVFHWKRHQEDAWKFFFSEKKDFECVHCQFRMHILNMHVDAL